MATDFMTRGDCGLWPDWLLQLYMFAHVGVFLAYVAIPLTIWLNMWAERRHTQDRKVAWLFVVFILLCGGGHLLEGVGAFYWPNYYVFTAWHLATCAISWWAALSLPGHLLRALNKSRT